MRQRRSVIAAVLLAAAIVVLSGSCRKADAVSGDGTSDRSNFTELGTFPVVKNKENINLMMSTYYAEFNPETNWMTKYYEDKSNVHVNWSVVPTEQFKERVNLALASADQIDVMITGLLTDNSYSLAEQQRLIQQGLILPTGDLFDTDSIYFKQRINAYEGWREAITHPDGRIYIIPTLSECYHCMFYGKMWVNKEFLKNVGLNYPTTIQEFHDMLVAFRDKDANGNGDPNDEIPFAGAAQQGVFSAKVDTFIMSSFIYDDGLDRLFVDDNGKVIAAFRQPEFQEGLQLLHQWYTEGLIYPETFTQNLDTRAKLNSQKYESIIGAIPYEHMYNSGNRDEGEPQRWVDYEAIAPLKGPHGVQTTRYAYYQKFNIDLPGGLIPSTSKNPALIIRWLDWFFSDEGNMVLINGEKGRAWDDADPGATGPDGSPAVFKTLTMSPTDPYYNNYRWGNQFPNFNSFQFRNEEQSAADMLAPDGSGAERYLFVKSRDNYFPYVPDPKNLIPPLYYSDANASEIARLQTDINTYVDECIAKFVVGDMNINTEWTRFQNELNNLGIERYLNIIQSTYDTSAFAK
jgi:putative aldouronate transport system substrate-binding protein